MTLTAFGSGQDTGDKAVMKAQTAALKYCYMMSLNISTGDDPEADVGIDARATGGASVAGAAASSQDAAPMQAANPKVTPEQLKIIFVLARRAGIADELMKGRIHKTFSVNSSRELTKVQASALIDELKDEAAGMDQAG